LSQRPFATPALQQTQCRSGITVGRVTSVNIYKTRLNMQQIIGPGFNLIMKQLQGLT